jgi:hypothetical protein
MSEPTSCRTVEVEFFTNKSNQSRHPAETQRPGAVFGARGGAGRGAAGCGGWYTPARTESPSLYGDGTTAALAPSLEQ